jgi:hypothetical protein
MLQKQVAGQFGFKLLFERQASDQTRSERGHAALHLIDELTLQFDLGGQRVHAREKIGQILDSNRKRVKVCEASVRRAKAK